MMSRCLVTPALIAVVVVAACGGESGTPMAPGTPTSPAPQVATALRIEGPATIAPGASAQYRAIASFTDGRTQDVTNEASWLANSTERVLLFEDGAVGARGMVTGGTPGEADLTVRYPAGLSTADGGVLFPPGTLSSSLRIMVLEPGTFRVSGLVTESGLPFPGIRVVVVAGKRAGLTAPTKSDGTYVMYGLAGPTELAVSEEAFQIATRSIVVSDHQTVHFSLQPLSGYDSLTGDWRLTLQASASCGSEIPPEAATRTVSARITQRGPQLSLDVSSPTKVAFNDYPVSGHGGVSGVSMSFRLQMDNEQHPPRWVLLEMLEPRRFLGIAGYAEGQRSGNTVVGWLSGEFSLYRTTGANYLAPGTALESTCYRKIGEDSSIHAFRLDRN